MAGGGGAGVGRRWGLERFWWFGSGPLMVGRDYVQVLEVAVRDAADSWGRVVARPGQVLQFDWVEMPTRPKIAGRERRVYALLGTLPYSGAQSAHFSFEMTLESFLEGHTRIFDWLGGVPRECVCDNLRSVVARRERDVVHWNPRFLHLRGHYAFHATACTPATPREKGSVEGGARYLQTGFWPARRIVSLQDLDGQYADWRDRVCNQRLHASGRFLVWERLAEERRALRPLAPTRFDYAYQRSSRVPLDGYLPFRQSFYRAPEALVHERVESRADRDTVWIVRRGEEVARYLRSYEPGSWLPAPRLRPEPPAPPAPARIAVPEVCPPELADYAELLRRRRPARRPRSANGCPTSCRS